MANEYGIPHSLGLDRICKACGRVVDRTKRVAIMVDGNLEVSVPLCFPCFEDTMDAVMPTLSKKECNAV